MAGTSPSARRQPSKRKPRKKTFEHETPVEPRALELRHATSEADRQPAIDVGGVKSGGEQEDARRRGDDDRPKNLRIHSAAPEASPWLRRQLFAVDRHRRRWARSE